jgi:hypothetical protein
MGSGWYEEIKYGSGDFPERSSWLEKEGLRLTQRGERFMSTVAILSALLMIAVLVWVVFALGASYQEVSG